MGVFEVFFLLIGFGTFMTGLLTLIVHMINKK
ncbi:MULTISPECIES: putative holin-like toxin [Virgibacillus]|nr:MULTISPECIES: putative holin-like toxin [Virgibacillus]